MLESARNELPDAVIIIVFEMVLVQKIERLNHLRIIGVGAFLTCLGFGLLPFGRSQAFCIFTVTIWTIGEMLFAPIGMAFAASRSGTRGRGAYMGLLSMSIAIPASFAPVVGTRLYGWHADSPWYGSLGLSVVTLLGFWLLSLKKPRPDSSGAG